MNDICPRCDREAKLVSRPLGGAWCERCNNEWNADIARIRVDVASRPEYVPQISSVHKGTGRLTDREADLDGEERYASCFVREKKK